MAFPTRLALAATLMLTLAASAGCRRAHADALTFSTWGSLDEIETLQPLLDEFRRAHPEVPVELVHIPDKYPHKVRLMAASGVMPDVLFMDNLNLAGFAKRGVLRDLKPFLDADPEVRPADFYRPVLDAMSWKGTLYGIPRDLSNLVVFYNKRLFKAAGVPEPADDWTYDQFVATARRLTHGETQWGFGFSPIPLFWLPFLWGDGVDLFNADVTKTTLLAPSTLAALGRYADLRLKHHVAPTEAQVGNARPSQLFAQEKVAMMVNGRWVVPGYRKKLAFDWDVAPLPRGATGRSVVDADASGWCISTACKRPQLAWQLVKFLASKKAITVFTASGLIVPSRPDVANSEAFFSGKPSRNRVFLDVIAGSRPTVAPPSYNEINYELIDGLPPAWSGEAPLAETLRPIAARVDALLREDAR